MPRYMVERTFPAGLQVPAEEEGAQACLAVMNRNAVDSVTWVHSYVSVDKKKTFCVYDAPTPEAVRRTANDNGLPVDSITEIRTLDPYFYF
jgi:Nickel responsive protein SCO4226-like